MFPEFKFQKIKLENIQNMSAEGLSFPFVIKPSIGFLSIGVHIINDENDWIQAKEELTPNKLKSIFPKNVLDTSYFVMEDFARGEEYAIDYYHNEKGEVVILNIMHHVFSQKMLRSWSYCNGNTCRTKSKKQKSLSALCCKGLLDHPTRKNQQEAQIQIRQNQHSQTNALN